MKFLVGEMFYAVVVSILLGVFLSMSASTISEQMEKLRLLKILKQRLQDFPRVAHAVILTASLIAIRLNASFVR